MERKGISDQELRELMGEGKIQPMPDYKSLRDEMAMAAMQGDWAAQRPEWHEFHVNEKPKFAMSAQMYYQMADAMLKARESSSADAGE